ncbi:hypothetical protein NYP20_15120 [Pseudomonas sp. N3-W]|uniref:hypothetical protein n=1 Tax=Pseudomonas sp. N3-W TaxID=2975049 RepID=UPI00217DE543|nr:hypothetical protein [Pseudomonas sp. N3-W]UWF46685.1 hypothetical protein NYP20_15120 [Pseudomonas sp. N3-W]
MKPDGYQPDDLDRRKVWPLLAMLLAAIVLCLSGVAWLLISHQQQFAAQQPPLSARESERLLPPAPRLQADPWSDGEQHMAADRQHLDSFGWVDREHGIVHLPLDQARPLLLQRGWPTPAQVPHEP